MLAKGSQPCCCCAKSRIDFSIKTGKKMDRIVLCMNWGTLFSPDYVNVLYNACKANLTGPFRFVCLTDSIDGLSDGIEAFPIPQIGCTREMYFSGAWALLHKSC
jgi:hypothetical protein